MTEPTQEQIEAERELVHSLGLNMCGFESWHLPGTHTIGCERTATALASRALEAETKGWDDAIRDMVDECTETIDANEKVRSVVKALRDGKR